MPLTWPNLKGTSHSTCLVPLLNCPPSHVPFFNRYTKHQACMTHKQQHCVKSCTFFYTKDSVMNALLTWFKIKCVMAFCLKILQIILQNDFLTFKQLTTQPHRKRGEKKRYTLFAGGISRQPLHFSAQAFSSLQDLKDTKTMLDNRLTVYTVIKMSYHLSVLIN